MRVVDAAKKDLRDEENDLNLCLRDPPDHSQTSKLRLSSNTSPSSSILLFHVMILRDTCWVGTYQRLRYRPSALRILCSHQIFPQVTTFYP